MDMTGVTAPFEPPEKPNIEINTEGETVSESVKRILEYIRPKLQKNNNE
jgi:adenylylsulfate kinase